MARSALGSSVVFAAACTLGAGALLAGCASAAHSDAPVENQAQQIDHASALVREAQQLDLSGKSAQAATKYQEAIGVYRELPVAWNNLGVLLRRSGDNLRAADAFKTAAELSPSDPRPMYNLGAVWEDLGYLEDAEHWYDEALNRDNNYLNALRRRVLVDMLRDRVDDRTADCVRRALLQERDPWWSDYLRRAELRVRQADKTPMPPAPGPARALPPLSPTSAPALSPAPAG